MEQSQSSNAVIDINIKNTKDKIWGPSLWNVIHRSSYDQLKGATDIPPDDSEETTESSFSYDDSISSENEDSISSENDTKLNINGKYFDDDLEAQGVSLQFKPIFGRCGSSSAYTFLYNEIDQIIINKTSGNYLPHDDISDDIPLNLSEHENATELIKLS